jgi:hypothetical protein
MRPCPHGDPKRRRAERVCVSLNRRCGGHPATRLLARGRTSKTPRAPGRLNASVSPNEKWNDSISGTKSSLDNDRAQADHAATASTAWPLGEGACPSIGFLRNPSAALLTVRDGRRWRSFVLFALLLG